MKFIEAAFEVTNACNLRCMHCYSEGAVGFSDELETDEAIDVLRQCAELGIEKMKFGGGEPLARTDFIELYDYAIARGFETQFSTNSLLIDEDTIMMYKDAGMKKIQVSIDGPRNVHDLFRGKKGLFNKAIESIKLLREHDIDVNVASTLTTYNMDKLFMLGHNLSSLDIKRWRIMKYIPCGRGTIELMPTPEQYKRAAESFYDLKNVIKPEIVIAREFNCNQAKDYNDMLCTGARTTFSIKPNGDITPCSFIDIIAGNVRENSLEDILTGDVMRDFREIEYNTGCGYYNKCKGGCKAVSYNLNGEFGCDIYCWVNSSAKK